MSNKNTVPGTDRELTLLLGTYWFDFEQAAELGNAALSLLPPAPERGTEAVSESAIPEYAI